MKDHASREGAACVTALQAMTYITDRSRQMTKKQEKQLAVLAILLAAALCCWFIISRATAAKEAASQSDAKINVLTLDTDQISSLSWTDASGNATTLNYDEGEWAFADADLGTVASGDADTLADDVSSVMAIQQFDNVDDLSQYGLDNPAITITITLTDGSQDVLKIGDYNSTVSAYYLQLNDEDTVYTINNTLYTAFNIPSSSLIADTASSDAGS